MAEGGHWDPPPEFETFSVQKATYSVMVYVVHTWLYTKFPGERKKQEEIIYNNLL